MEENQSLRLQPAEVADASKQLDELADRFDKLMQAEHPNLEVQPPGRDEVSQTVASTLNEVHSGFAKSAGHGTNEIREIAATLRAHSSDIASADRDFTA